MKMNELKPLESNPFKSKGDKQIESIAKSIKEFSKMMELRPIIIDEDNNILGGNKRFFALKTLGYEEIPDNWIKKATELSEEQKKEFIVKDNSHWGSMWDYGILTDWEIDLVDYGIVETLGELDKLGQVNNKENEEWVGMPDFDIKDSSFKIIIHFEKETDRLKFLEEYPMEFVKKESKAWSTWYPFKERDDLSSVRYEEEDEQD